MKLNGFGKYYSSVIVRPGQGFKDLLENKNSLSLSFFAVSITAVVYTLVYVFLILGGGQPFKPWLNIPIDVYYKYNVFFCAPSMYLGWILAAGVVHTISRIVTGTGTFESILCTFGFGISIASWTTGIHDIVTSFLGAFHIINQHNYEIALNSPTIWRTLLWILMIAYLIWFVILFSKAVKTVYQLKTGTSIFLGLLGFMVYQVFFFIFNR